MRVSDTKWPRALVGGFQASLQHGLSAGFGQELSQTLGWGIPAERFAWAAVELGGVPMAAGITRSTPGERAPLLPLTLSHATARGHRTGDQDRWSPTGAAWPASVVPVTPPRTGRATAHRYSPASPSLAVPRVREPAGPLRHVLGLSPARTTTGPPPHPAVVGGQRANPLHSAWIAGPDGNPGMVPAFTINRSSGEVASYTPAVSPRLRRRPSPWPPDRRPRYRPRSSPPRDEVTGAHRDPAQIHRISSWRET